MKVFVYSKKDNSTIAVFVGVQHVYYYESAGTPYIAIIDSNGDTDTYDRRIVKTRIYQN